MEVPAKRSERVIFAHHFQAQGLNGIFIHAWIGKAMGVCTGQSRPSELQYGVLASGDIYALIKAIAGASFLMMGLLLLLTAVRIYILQRALRYET